jgi:hypothetical protein
MNKIDQLAAYPQPVIKGKKDNYKYTQTPSELNEVLKGVLEMIFQEETSNIPFRQGESQKCVVNKIDIVKKNKKSESIKNLITLSGDRLTIKKIENYFLNNFEYTLSPKGAEDTMDPVEFFLTKSKCGHCELFASAAALLLRKKGIPARYVTGLICFERHPSQDYYVARLANAHAWVEAFLRDENRWVLVEATPPSAGEFNTSFGTFDAWGDRLNQLWRKTFAGIRRGYVARSILTLLTSLFGFLSDFLWHPLRGSVCFLLGLFFLWTWKRFGERKRKTLDLPPKIAGLSAKFAKLVKKIQKKVGIPKSRYESVEEWYARIANCFPEELGRNLRNLLRSYNNVRFSTESPSQNELLELDKQMADFRRKLKKVRNIRFEPNNFDCLHGNDYLI